MDTEPLNTYKVENGHSLHMVARPLGAPLSSPPASNTASATTTAAGSTNNETNHATNNAGARAGTLGQRLLMGMGVPAFAGQAVPAGAGVAGIGVGGGGNGSDADNALLNAAAGLDGGQFLSNMLGLAGAGTGSGLGAAAQTPQASLWNGLEGRGTRGTGRETAPAAGGVAAAGGGDEDGEEGQTDLEHVRQGLLTLHTLLSGTSNGRRQRGEVVAPTGGNSSGVAAISPTSSPLHSLSPSAGSREPSWLRGLTMSSVSAGTLLVGVHEVQLPL